MTGADIFTESVFDPDVTFTRLPVGRTQPAEPGHRSAVVTFAPAMMRSAVASILSTCVLIAPIDATASQNVLKPSVITVAEAAGDYRPAKWRDFLQAEIQRFLAYPEGWEPGAPAISPIAANAVRETLELGAAVVEIPMPAVVPTVDGGIQVEWHENGVDLEVRGAPDGGVVAYFVQGNEEREIVVRKPRQLRRLLRELVADRMHADR